MKKITSLLMAVLMAFSVMSIPASAENVAETTVVVTVNGIDFIFDSATSEEFRSKFIEDYFNHDNDGAAVYGLTCTLFGHDFESSVVTTVTHNARTSDPKCLQETYSVETCTRCDYSAKTLVESRYISCC